MNILAPLKNSHEIMSLIEAGADEFFCGVTPPEWASRHGSAWINRRAPQSAGVPDLDDFERIVSLAEGRPVYVTLNAPFYPPGGVETLTEFGAELM